MIDFATLEAAWRSSANNPSAAANAYLAEELAATINRRRTALDRTLVFAGVLLALWLGRIVIDVISGRANPLALLQEWATLPLLAVPIAVWIVLFRVRRQDRRADARMPLGEAFRLALAENGATRLHLRIIAAGQLVSAPLLYATLAQLERSGKMAPHEQLSAAVVLGGALAASFVFVLVRYFTQVIPERDQLASLVRQYQD
jgi:hypothetical protein